MEYSSNRVMTYPVESDSTWETALVSESILLSSRITLPTGRSVGTSMPQSCTYELYSFSAVSAEVSLIANDLRRTLMNRTTWRESPLFTWSDLASRSVHSVSGLYQGSFWRVGRSSLSNIRVRFERSPRGVLALPSCGTFFV